MADLVIRGMRIPPQCVLYDEYRVIYYKCPFADEGKWDVLVCTCPNQKRGARIVNDYTETRHPDCPLVPLPEGHGRMVDAEEIRNRLVRKLTACKPGTIEELTFAISIDIVDHADTIVPAEGGNADDSKL